MRVASLLLTAIGLSGCADVLGLETDGYRVRPPASGTSGELVTLRVSPARTKIDFLLVADNSLSMADKQAYLAESTNDALSRLVNPPCIDRTRSETLPAPGANGTCPVGTERTHPPVTDLHIGIITSSLGAHGGDICNDPAYDDHAHLLGSLERGRQVPTYEGLGFFAWDPEQRQTPPGTSDLVELSVNLQSLLNTAGEEGCGLDAPLEAMYRFLVEPEPHESVRQEDGVSVIEGLDQVLLDQRASFLRPDSLVAIVLLSDENDCSIADSGVGWLVARTPTAGLMPLATSACDGNPNDVCCRSCSAVEDPDGCIPAAEDVGCQALYHDIASDPPNLRCFDQKRRFGMDLLHPIGRYVSGLRDPEVPNREGVLVDNPLLTSGELRRNPSDVVLAGIVGVPWQLLARDASASPLVLRTPEEMATDGTWERILGDPPSNVPPTDPHMVESRYPRPGLPGPDAPVGTWDEIHGHEYEPDSDLQYACISQLPEARVCANEWCDCQPGQATGPLCRDPESGVSGELQYFSKAYPGLRELAVIKALGPSGVVGSICPRNTTDDASLDYFYRPHVSAIASRLASKIRGGCLETPLKHESGTVACVLIEALPTGSSACDCARPGRFAVEPTKAALAQSELERSGQGDRCLCQIDQHFEHGLDSCLHQVEPVASAGWCYVAEEASWPDVEMPATGDPRLLEGCPAGGRQALRFTGGSDPNPDAELLLMCATDTPRRLNSAPTCTAGVNCGGCAQACDRCLCQRRGDMATCKKILECE